MISSLVSRLVILVFGNLYPAYASYKAVRTRNVKEYVKWMMYWIVFAFFTCIETCTDIFLSWFPFYYEIKVLIVVWLLSPATKGSSTLYRKFVHPMLTRREQEIDEYLNQAKERGYSAVLQLGSKGVNYATSVIMQTAIKTVQLSYNVTNGTSDMRALTTSQSEGALNVRGGNAHGRGDERDELDDGMTVIEERFIVRSTSHNGFAAANRNEYSEDDDEQEGAMLATTADLAAYDELAGAARIREPPMRKVKAARKTNSRESNKTAKSKEQNGLPGIRSRRRLRDPTPDLDIEVE